MILYVYFSIRFVAKKIVNTYLRLEIRKYLKKNTFKTCFLVHNNRLYLCGLDRYVILNVYYEVKYRYQMF